MLEFLLSNKEIVISVITAVILLIVAISCYPKWINLWHDFGKNLYYFLNK
jgi:hypothetical protein